MIASTEAIWRSSRAPLLRAIRRRVDSEADAEDILQDVFERVHTKIGGLQDTERLEGWLRRIAANAITDHHRRQNAQRRALDRFAVEPGSCSEEDWLAEVLSTYVGVLAEGLDEPYREALALTDLGTLTQREAASQLGLSPSGMKSRVQRGRAQLRGLVDACCAIELDRRQKVIECEPHQISCACAPD